MSNDFLRWIIEESKNRGWNDSELARQMNVSPATVSRVVNGQLQPTWDFCAGVAHAFKLTEIEVFRRAGKMRRRPQRDPYFEVLEDIWEMTPDWKKRDMVVSLRAFLEDRGIYRPERTIPEEEPESDEPS